MALDYLAFCRYIVAPDEKQATFTGAQQRAGVPVLPFLVDRLFALLCQHKWDGSSADRGQQARRPAHPATTGTVDDAEQSEAELPQDEDGDEDASDDEASYKLGKDFVYDWKAYHNAFGDKPWEDAVTEMFCEYACLHGRISGHVGATLPTPMTLSKGKSIHEQAVKFITKYVTPILGRIFSTKFHKLLRHVLDAVRLHGNLRNGNTSANEAYHKADKAFYGRTNKDFETFTYQLVRHAQGSREILAKHMRLRESVEVAALARAGAEHGRCAGAGTSSGDRDGHGDGSSTEALTGVCAGARSSIGGTAAAGVSGEAETGAMAFVPASCAPPPGPAAHNRGKQATPRADGGRGLRTDYLHEESVAELCQRPGMANAGAVLGLAAEDKVRVLSRVAFTARLDCGGLHPQLLYAHTWFRGGPWFDAVVYNIGSDVERTYIGEVRAIVRYQDRDVALIREWEPVDPLPGCPFSARGCTRLRWLVHEGDACISVREVPVANVRRLAHVVPDFGDLLARRGIEADPAGLWAPLCDELDMRFFVNAFLPWV